MWREALLGWKALLRLIGPWGDLLWRIGSLLWLLGGETALKRLLRISTWRKILLLMNSLSHTLEHVLRNLANLVHVGFLLHALLRVRDRVKRTLLLREWRDILGRGRGKPTGD